MCLTHLSKIKQFPYFLVSLLENYLMKIALVSISVVLILFIIIQLFALKSQNNIETYPYTVVKKYDDFEIRNYEASLFSSVTIPSNRYEEASGSGFSVLAGYIFGGNSAQEKIAMTSPVAMTLSDSMEVMFMVPRNIKKEDLPSPNSSQIIFKEEPAKKVAAIRFGGWANTEKINAHKEKLKQALEKNKIPYTNRSYFFGYNPPYEVANRKNEVIIELESGLRS